ncbi:hypothetical protein [Streptomyces vietnamensis]|uniref:hypothetical protein n=1 Tax=Streptomyces vietnamensis TaxID=362257 RepID=UPI00343CB826
MSGQLPPGVAGVTPTGVHSAMITQFFDAGTPPAQALPAPFRTTAPVPARP